MTKRDEKAARLSLARDLRLGRYADRVFQRALAEERKAVLAALGNGGVKSAAKRVTMGRWVEAHRLVYAQAEKLVWNDTVKDLGGKTIPVPRGTWDALIEKQARLVVDDHRELILGLTVE